MFEPFYNSGTIYLRQKSFSKSIQQFNVAGRLKPTDPFVQNNLGVAYEGLHDEVNAAKAFRKAADMSPTNLTFAHNAGLALSKLRSQDALPYLEKCLGDGKDPAVALALGEAYARSGRRGDALKYYEGLREAEAGNATFWFNLGVLRAQNGDGEGAEKAYRRALEIRPNDLDSLNNLGLILYRKGDFAGAVLAFTTLDFVAVALFDCFGAGSDATTSAGAITASGLIVSDLVLVVDFVCFFAGLADSLEVGKLAVSIGSEFSVGEANFFRGMAFGLRQVWPNWSAHRRFQR